jgi:uncharacterized protein (TIGR02231 family)
MSPVACLFLALAAAQQAAEPRSVESTIAEVTVYAGTASVRRRAVLPGSGRFALRGLPAGLDPESVRVRLEGGEVVGVEVRQRYQANVPDERVKDLRARIRALEREIGVLEDERSILSTMQDHVGRLLKQEERVHQEEVEQGRVNPEAWEANYRYLGGKLKELKESLRELGLEREEKELALNDLRLELGRFESAGGVQLQDVIVDVVGSGGNLELDYVVGDAGWEPYYDLRARKDLSAVELAYRAQVHQHTGEDWREAEILLSTAQPQRGAQGPEPQPIWLSLVDPKAPRGRRAPAAEMESLEALGYAGDGAAGAPAETAALKAFAAVESEGISVRFRLPRKETIESRAEPTTVLVGRTDLALVPEHFCVPALDPTVWIRARARNTSEWVMLPGRAAVYFGADFVGHAWLEAVQLQQELTLHLGADPGLSVERTQLEDLREGSGVFSSRATQRESWKIEIENHGAFTHAKDGSVELIVQEVLPRPRDDRIKVEIAAVQPKLSEDERWKKEREEKGVLTWVVRLPKGGKSQLLLTTEIGFPEDMKLIRR